MCHLVALFDLHTEELRNLYQVTEGCDLTPSVGSVSEVQLSKKPPQAASFTESREVTLPYQSLRRLY
ncbi:hypothetical protein AMECASPLE_012379 [Ameca splendens]|uniref:Uncharacterized protein n=1 Tax=Ameca splendens TaxID=208324 RepID=A0ABV0YBX4_9TELE